MARTTSGFTLIELMIVVAIVGILAAIAIPQYQDYVARAQVAEAAHLAAGLKTVVAEVIQQEGTAINADSGYRSIPSAENIVGRYVEQVSVSDGTISALMKPAGLSGTSALVGARTLTLSFQGGASAVGSLEWTCDGTIDSKFRPKNC